MMVGSTHLCDPLAPILSAEACPALWTVTCEESGCFRQVSGTSFALRVAALSAALTHDLGVRPGDVVAIVAHNSERLYGALLAIADAGALPAPLNWRWSLAELTYALQLTTPVLLFSDATCRPLVRHLPSRPRLLHLGEDIFRPPTENQEDNLATETLISSYLSASRPPPCLQLLRPHDGAAMLVFTSGSTGRPKAVVLSHAAFHAQSLAKLSAVGYSAVDVYLHTSPLFHVGGLSSALALLTVGGSHVFVPRFSAAAALAAVRRHRVTTFIAVPTMLWDMAREELPGLGSVAAAQRSSSSSSSSSSAATACGTALCRELSSVRTILVGAGGTSAELLATTRAIFPAAAIHTAYGMTEACSSMTFLTMYQPPSQQPPHAPPSSSLKAAAALPARGAACVTPGRGRAALSGAAASANPGSAHAGAWMGACVGRAAPGVELAVRHGAQWPLDGAHAEVAASASGAAAPSAAPQLLVGEVWTRGTHVMLRYWRDTAETDKALQPQGWLRTGDLGHWDDNGCLWLMGRGRDVIRSGGESVHAVEVEAALAAHPHVLAAAVVGLPDARMGQQVAALVVLRPGVEWDGPWATAPGVPPPSASTAPPAAAQGSSGGAAASSTGTTAGYDSHRSSCDEGVAGGAVTVGQVPLALASLQAHCRARGLSSYKVPRTVVLLAGPGLPLTSTGKVIKAEVLAILQGVVANSATGSAGAAPRAADRQPYSRL